jgi:hypothetical protein
MTVKITQEYFAFKREKVMEKIRGVSGAAVYCSYKHSVTQ